MDIETQTWLFDILKAIEEIDGYFVERPKDFSTFVRDIRTKRAVERNIEIIGEAMTRILKKNDSIPISDARKIVAVRNRIIHSYDAVSDDIIWSIMMRHLPILKQEAQKLLSEIS